MTDALADKLTAIAAEQGLDISVAYDTDIDAATDLINQVGEEMQSDEEWGPRLLEAPKVMRVNALADSAVTLKVLGQVRAGVSGRKAEQIAAMVIAYEPIWAIGTGRTATPDDAQGMIATIRKVAAGVAGDETAARIRIQYGGSVKSSNIAELMAQPDIDGALVGGASLDPDEFARIVQYRLGG